MPRTANKTEIPNRLIEAGYSLFNQLGYNATGIQQIADKAGVPKGSFYNHFDSKEAFAVRIIDSYACFVDTSWDACMQDAPAAPLDAIRHVFTRFARHHEERGCQGCLVGNFAAEMAESSDMCRSALKGVITNWNTRLAQLIEQAQEQGTVRRDLDARTLARFFWDAWEGAVLRTKIQHDVAPLQEVLSLTLDKFFQP